VARNATGCSCAAARRCTRSTSTRRARRTFDTLHIGDERRRLVV
jgi:hypothetical protein